MIKCVKFAIDKMEYEDYYLVEYESGRVKIFFKHEKLPKTVQEYIKKHPNTRTEVNKNFPKITYTVYE